MQVEHFVAGFEPETCGQRTGNPGRVGERQRDLVARMKRGMRGPDRIGEHAAAPEPQRVHRRPALFRSEEHTSELQSLMRISYAVFCLKKKKTNTNETQQQ